ncbi:uncharacterized protein [Aegilops tauschii subsp. strangulata]|uniref:uncharacterized protein n=1 Tax=Aegilops tauschii subsp. strangulata TaxID=200361 RepID=UPI003CC87FC8
MGGIAPKNIIIDQDFAMRSAIDEVFIGIVHRNCCWHTMKKAQAKLGKLMADDEPLNKAFKDCVDNSMTVDGSDKVMASVSEQLETMYKETEMYSMNPLEMQVRGLYTHNLFCKFQVEMKVKSAYRCDTLDGGTFKVSLVRGIIPKYGDRDYHVQANIDEETYSCSCCKLARKHLYNFKEELETLKNNQLKKQERKRKKQKDRFKDIRIPARYLWGG